MEKIAQVLQEKMNDSDLPVWDKSPVTGEQRRGRETD